MMSYYNNVPSKQKSWPRIRSILFFMQQLFIKQEVWIVFLVYLVWQFVCSLCKITDKWHKRYIQKNMYGKKAGHENIIIVFYPTNVLLKKNLISVCQNFFDVSIVARLWSC